MKTNKLSIYLKLASKYRNTDHSKFLMYMSLASNYRLQDKTRPAVVITEEMAGYYGDLVSCSETDKLHTPGGQEEIGNIQWDERPPI